MVPSKPTTAGSFDYLVGAEQERRWNRHSNCLRGLYIDNQLELVLLIDRNLAWVRVRIWSM